MPEALPETTGGIMFETSIGGKRGLGLCDWRKSLSTDLLACRMKLCLYLEGSLGRSCVANDSAKLRFDAGVGDYSARVLREN